MASMLRQCLGVDLGVHTVKIVELAVDKNGVRTIRAASQPTGVSPSMTQEEIRSAIVAAGKELIKKARFGTKKAVFGVSGQKVFFRRFRLPKTSDERLQRMIQYEARQQIPFPIDKTLVQFQYRELPEDGDVEVLLVAIRSDEIRDHMTLIQRMGLAPVAVGVSSFALLSTHRFINLSADDAEEVLDVILKRKKKAGGKKAAPAPVPHMAGSADETIKLDVDQIPGDAFNYEEIKGFVNLGAGSYDLAIPHSSKGAGLVGFIRTVPLGGDEMTKAIMRSCQIESFRDAELIKTSSTQLMGFSFDFENEGQTNQEASMAATEVADKIIGEVRRSLEFFITQPDGVAIDALVVSGGQAMMPGIESYLEEKLAMPVTIVREVPEGSPLKWPTSVGPMTPYMIATGLALQGLGASEIKIDFLPEEAKIVRDFPYRALAVMGAILLGTIGFASQAGKQYADMYRVKQQSLEGEMLKIQQTVEQFNQTQQLHNETADKFAALAKSFGQRSYWVQFLGDLADCKPPGIVVTQLQMGHDGTVKIVAASEVQADAPEFSEAIARRFKDRVAGKVNIDKVDKLKASPPFDKDYHSFTISFKMGDKVNHLDVTPTPVPNATPTPRAGGGR